MARRLVLALLFAIVVVALLATAPVADAARGGGKGSGKGPKTTSLTGTAAIQYAHDTVCPKVVEYAECSTISVNIAYFDASWAGWSHPADNAIDYNSRFDASVDAWSNVVAHEVGGHIDVWQEIVAKVGVTQAWTDYYDIDVFAQPWAAAQWQSVTGNTRAFTSSDAKEAFIDCAGPNAHGYQANYLYSWGLYSSESRNLFCAGYEQVLDRALVESR